MPEPIVINGKKFITSKQAAALTGYARDYVGQLVRMGKVKGQVIDKVLFVSEDSILAHANVKNSNAKIVENSFKSAMAEAAVTTPVVSKVITSSEPAQFIPKLSKNISARKDTVITGSKKIVSKFKNNQVPHLVAQIAPYADAIGKVTSYTLKHAIGVVAVLTVLTTSYASINKPEQFLNNLSKVFSNTATKIVVKEKNDANVISSFNQFARNFNSGVNNFLGIGKRDVETTVVLLPSKVVTATTTIVREYATTTVVKYVQGNGNISPLVVNNSVSIDPRVDVLISDFENFKAFSNGQVDKIYESVGNTVSNISTSGGTTVVEATGTTTLSNLTIENTSTSTIPNLEVTSAFTLNGDTITDFVGAGLELSNGVLTATAGSGFSTTSNNYWESTQNRWSTTSDSYAFDTRLAAVTNLTGLTNLISTNATVTALTLGSDYITDLTGSGLTVVNGALTASGGTGFSTTSADYWETIQSRWATTSTDFWLTTKSTTNIAEGSNLYWTDARFDTRLSATTTLPNLAVLRGLTDIISTRGTTTNATSTNFFAATASTTNLFVGGNLSIGTSSQSASLNIERADGLNSVFIGRTGSASLGIHMAGGFVNLSPNGGALNISSNFVDGLAKNFRLTFSHYNSITNGTACALVGLSDANFTSLGVGGGSSGCNAPSNIVLYTGITSTTTVGTIGFLLDNNQNIGIGIASPTAKVNIVGRAGSTTDLFKVASSTLTDIFIVKSTGDVGVGTTTPTQRFSVNGNVWITGNATSSTFAATSTTATSTLPLLSVNALSVNGVYTNSLWSTTSDSYAFDTRLAATTTLNNVIKIGTQSSFSFGNATGSSLYLTSLDCTLYANGGKITTDGNGMLVCANDSTGSGGGGGGTDVNWTFINNSGIAVSTTTNQVVIGASATSSLQRLQVSGGIYVTGNVGIGTTSPYESLSVSGNAVITGITRSSNFIATSTTATSTFPNITFTNLSFGSDYITDLTGSGLSVVDGALTALGDGTFSTTSSDYYLSTKSTTNIAEGSNLYWTDARFDTRLSATTTLPNLAVLRGLTDVITTNATTTTFALGSDYITDLTGSGLSVVNGALTATDTSWSTTSATFWESTQSRWSTSSDSLAFDTRLAATTTLNNITTLGGLSLPLTQTTGTLSVARGGTGQTSFGQGWLASDGTTLTSSTSPTVNYITATSTTGTSTFPLLSVNALTLNGTYVNSLWSTTSSNYFLLSTSSIGTINTLSGLASIGSTSGLTTVQGNLNVAGVAAFNGATIASNTGLLVQGSADTGSSAYAVRGNAAGSSDTFGILGYDNSNACNGLCTVVGVYAESNTSGGKAIAGSASGNAIAGYFVSASGNALEAFSTDGYGLNVGSTNSIGLNVSGGTYGIYSTNAKNYFERNVGIGTSTPSAMLAVAGDVLANIFTATSTTATSTLPLLVSGRLSLSGSQNGDDNVVVIDGGDDYARTITFNEGGIQNGYLRFDHNQDVFSMWNSLSLGTLQFGTNNLERMTIDYTGNVGIGTTSPYAKLSVVGQTVAEYFTATSTTSTSTLPKLSSTYIQLDGDTLSDFTGTGLTNVNGVLTVNAASFVGTGVDGQVPYFASAGSALTATSSLFIATSSWVGVGTTTPQAGLHVIVQSRPNYREDFIKFNTTDVGNDAGYLSNGSVLNGNFITTLAGYTESSASQPSLNLRGITSAANDVSDSSSFGIIDLLSVITSDPGNPNNGTLTSVTNRKLLTIRGGISGTNDIKFMIAASGNVGIGTTSPYAKLSVVGQTVAEYFTATSTTATSTFPLLSTNALTINGQYFTSLWSTTTDSLAFDTRLAATTTLNNINILSGLASVGSTTGTTTFLGSSIVNGNFGIGTSSPVGRFEIAGGSQGDSVRFITSGGASNRTLTFDRTLATNGWSMQTYITNANGATGVLNINPLGGNVGIGTTSPYAALSVNGETAALRFTATSTTVASVFPLFTSTNGTTTFATSTNFFATTASTTDIFVGGGISIGTTTGNSRLEIFNNTSLPALSIDAGVTGNDIFRIYRGGLNGGTGAGMALTAPSNSPQFQFRTGLSSLPGGSGVGTTRAVVSYDSTLGAFVIATSSIASGAIGIEPFIIKNTSSNVGLAGTSTPWGSVSINGSYQSAGEPTFVVGSSTKTDLIIDQAGEVGIGTTSPWRTFSVNGSVAMNGLTTAAGTPSSICMNTATKEITVNAATSCVVSDRDQKQQIQDLTVSGLDAIRQIKPVTFAYNDLPGRSRIGFIAQDLQAVDDRLGDAFDKNHIARSIDIPAIMSITVKAVKELDTKVTNEASTTESKFLQVLGAKPSSADNFLINGDLTFKNNFTIKTEGEGAPSKYLTLNSSNGSNVITFADNGNIGIGTGTTTPSYKLQVQGDIAATAFVNISTIDSKTDISYLTDDKKGDILTTLNSMKIARYHYKTEDKTNPLRLGLIAEEAPSEVLSVSGKGVDVYKLSTFAIAAIQAQQKQIMSLDARVTALEAKIASSTPAVINKDEITASVIAGLKDLFKVEKLTVGSKEKPTGITLFDEKTGLPYCLKIVNGNMSSAFGECGAVVEKPVEITLPPAQGIDEATSTPVTSTSTPTIIEPTSTSTPTTTPEVITPVVEETATSTATSTTP